jgi:hypothetical protein
MRNNVVKLPRALPKIECSSCGATADAACDCGAPYVSAGAKAAKAVAANPEKSNRAIAAEIGVGLGTVNRARKLTEPNGSVEKRVGLDGKARKHPTRRAPAFPTRVFVSDGKGGRRRASPEEETAAFGAANLIANPIADAWEKADEEERSSFVRLYQAEILERAAQRDAPATPT